MHPDSIAILTLATYAAIGAGIVGWRIFRRDVSWLVSALYAAERLYTGLVFHWRSNRRSNIPQEGPGLVISNHRSPVDPQFIWMNHHLAGPKRRIRVISYLVAREYYEVKATKWICKAMEAIPVGRDGKDMAPAREALRLLKAGKLVGVFPEGRINTGPSGSPLLPADTGIAWLALRAQVPVYPVYIHDAPRCVNMVSPFITPSRVRVCFGDPIDLAVYKDRRITRELLQEVTALLMSRLEETGHAEDDATEESDAAATLRFAPLKRAAN
ncbi:MAG: lysophospholipid acyltransferase family protein [Planctomycetaceae bacterium]